MLSHYFMSNSVKPLFLCGDSCGILKSFPNTCIDMIMTSPPYWGKREYESAKSIGMEKNHNDYSRRLLDVFIELRRILKPTGSFWLNLGDAYLHKNLLGLPWRIAIKMCDEQGWILRNSVVWNKIKGGPDNSTDKLRNSHEILFHFVKSKKY